MTALVETRKPSGHRFVDLSGTVSPHGVEFIRHVGFMREYAVFECVCPRCQQNFVMRGNVRNVQKTCGRCRPKRKPRQSEAVKARWRAMKRDCVMQWQVWELFWEDVGKNLQRNDRIFAADRTRPVGPDNFFVTDAPNLGNTYPHMPIWSLCDSYWTVARLCHELGTTKQNMHQRMATESGRARVMEDLQRKIGEGAS